MRYNLKFTILKNRTVSLYFLKKRVFNFKRSKWKLSQKKLIVFKNLIKKLQKSIINPPSKQVKFELIKHSLIKDLIRNSKKIKFKRRNFLINEILSKKKIFILKRALRLNNVLNTKFNLIKIKIKAWDRIRFIFRTCLNSTSHLKNYFDNCFSTKFYKKQFSKSFIRSFIISSVAIFPEYRLDILLWRLHFFPSAYAAQKSVLLKHLYVNFLQTNSKLFLQFGDEVLIKQIKKIQFLKNSNRYTFSNLILPHIEVDYFLGKIIIIKQWNSFFEKDFSLIIKNNLKIEKIKNYFFN